jgi:hypothetical protein
MEDCWKKKTVILSLPLHLTISIIVPRLKNPIISLFLIILFSLMGSRPKTPFSKRRIFLQNRKALLSNQKILIVLQTTVG